MADAQIIMESSPEDAIRDCIMNEGDVDDLVILLEDKRADPNCKLQYKLGPKSFDGTPLTLAVKKGRIEMVKKLIERKADPQSKYSMKAGKLAVNWEGPAVCAALPSGNLSMIRLLVEYDADVTGRVISFNGEPNGTCLYDACYFGQVHLVRYLISAKCELDVAVKFQDDMNIKFTPLHIACKTGRHEVVQVLLQAGARVPAAQEWGPPPLKDAIDGCHVEIVRLLIENSADLFTGFGDGKLPERRGMDHLIQVNNRVLLAAAANGLYYATQKSEKAIENIRIEDFIHFLGLENAEKIIAAIFIKREIRYWKDGNRDVWKSAYVEDEMNVAIGPSFKLLESNFEAVKARGSVQEAQGKQVEDNHHPEVEAFMEELLPNRWRLSKSVGECQVPVDIYQCVLPNIHHNVDVLQAIAAGSNREIFEEPGCKAIINVGFNQSLFSQKVTLFLDTVFATLFLLLASCLDKASPLSKKEWPRHVCLSLALIIWLRNWVREFLQFLGSTYNGKCRGYFANLDNWLDLTRMILTGASLISMFADWQVYQDGDILPLLVFAIAGIFRWVKLLGTLKGFQSTGKPMLPILNAVPDTAPFLLVCICYMLAFIHAYYSFNVTDGYASALNIYRLGFLGDFEMSDFGVPEVEDGGVKTYKWYINLLFLAVSFSFTVCFLNILVGVLGESYNRGYERREQLFHLERSVLSLQHFTISQAWNRIFCRRRLQQVLPYKIDGAEEEDCRMDYVWFCHVRDSPSMTEDDSTDHEQNVHEKVNDLRRDIKNLAQMTMLPGTPGLTRMGSLAPMDIAVDQRLGNLEKVTAELLDGMKAIQAALGDHRTRPTTSLMEDEKTAGSW